MGYQMTKAMFKSLVKSRKGEELKMNPYKFVCKYINDFFGLKGTVKKIVIKG